MDSKNVKTVLKTQTKVIAYVVICLTVIVIGISYSLYSDVKHNTTNQVVKAGTLTFNYEHGAAITSSANESCFNQMTDDDAKTNTGCSINVTVQNTGSLPGTFSLKLKKADTATNHIDLSKLKVILKKDSTIQAGFPKKVSEVTTSLVSGTLQSKASVQYTIQIYVDDTIEESEDNKNIAIEVVGDAEVSTTGNDINPKQ